SPYLFYQYWLNVSDEDAINLIKIFTFLPIEEIEELIVTHAETPHLRILQTKLAVEITTMVHSAEDVTFAQKASNILFGKDTKDTLRSLNEQQLLEVMNGVPQVRYSKGALTEG